MQSVIVLSSKALNPYDGSAHGVTGTTRTDRGIRMTSIFVEVNHTGVRKKRPKCDGGLSRKYKSFCLSSKRSLHKIRTFKRLTNRNHFSK